MGSGNMKIFLRKRETYLGCKAWLSIQTFFWLCLDLVTDEDLHPFAATMASRTESRIGVF